MLMRKSMAEQPWFSENQQVLRNGLSEALKADDKLGMTDDQIASWHPTRVYEYPWVLNNAPLHRSVLDIGSNLQFDCALLGAGVKPLTIHATIQDLPGLGTIFPWRNNGRGGIQPLKCFERYKNDVSMLYGYLDDLHFVRVGSFDTILCLSVVEHLPVEEVGPLIDGMWRMLKPGGTLVITCDWFVDCPIDGGWWPLVLNHDLGPHFKKLGVTKFGTEEIPWVAGFKGSSWLDGDTVLSKWEGNRLGVYGFTIKKGW